MYFTKGPNASREGVGTRVFKATFSHFWFSGVPVPPDPNPSGSAHAPDKLVFVTYVSSECSSDSGQM